MAHSSLRYDGQAKVEEARQGIPINDGSGLRFKGWRFHTETEIATGAEIPSKKRKEKTALIVKALRKDAFAIAMDIGSENFMKPDGVNVLIDGLYENALPRLTSGAKDLYREGHNDTAALSRRRRESMMSSTNCRPRGAS